MEKESIEKRSKTQNTVFIVIFIVFIIYGLSLLFPIVWGLISSLKNGAIEYFSEPLRLPQKWKWENYPKAMEMLSANGIGFAEMLINSLWFSFGGTLVGISTLSLFAYTLSRFNFVGKNLIIAVSITMMMIPIYGALPSQYKMYHSILGIAGSPLILLTFTGIMGTNSLLITHAFYKNLPRALGDAAKIDGAGEWVIFLKIYQPQAIGILLSFFLTDFIAHWNDYMTPMLYLQNMPTLSTGLYTYQTIVERSGNFPLYFAGSMLCIVPIIILYSLLSDKLMNNMSYSGIKG